MRIALLLLMSLLAGCATQPEIPDVPLSGDGFALTGRVSMKYAAEAASGKLAWQHDVASDDLLFSTPLGQGVARIVRRDGVVTLTTSENREFRASDAEALTQQVLGWRIPLTGLPDWVRGRVSPGTPAETRRDPSGRLSELRQAGWLVEFVDYRVGGTLPARLRLSREDLEIRLVIDTWQPAP